MINYERCHKKVKNGSDLCLSKAPTFCWLFFDFAPYLVFCKGIQWFVDLKMNKIMLFWPIFVGEWLKCGVEWSIVVLN
jgi:hypothetical protein